MSLTEIVIRVAKPKATVTKLSDDGGVQLWVMQGGSKLWYFAYRFTSLQKKLVIGDLLNFQSGK